MTNLGWGEKMKSKLKLNQNCNMRELRVQCDKWRLSSRTFAAHYSQKLVSISVTFLYLASGRFCFELL